MAKLKLNPSPTFKKSVDIPVAGDEPAQVLFTFKHMNKDALEKFIDSLDKRTDEESVLLMAEGWDLEDEFNLESAKTLCSNYIGAGLAIFLAFREELTKARTKN
jgi:hypothetical protein